MSPVLLVMAAVATAVLSGVLIDRGVDDVAERNLVKIAEENTLRDGAHLQFTIRNHMGDLAPSGQAANGSDTPTPEEALAQLVGPKGLPSIYEALAAGLDFASINVYDTAGMLVWSREPVSGSTPALPPSGSKYWTAVEGRASSEVLMAQDTFSIDGVPVEIDVVQTFLPFRATPDSEIIAVLALDRDLNNSVAAKVEDAKPLIFEIGGSAIGILLLVSLGLLLASGRMKTLTEQRSAASAESEIRKLERRLGRVSDELEEAEDQIARTEKLAAFGLMSGDVAHNLRNLLGAIRNAAYLVNKKLSGGGTVAGDAKTKQFLQIIDQQITRANQIITDLMTFARPAPLNLAIKRMEEVVDDSVAGLDRKQNVRVLKRIGPKLSSIVADGEQLQRVFLKILNNAQDAMPGGGQITVSARNLDKYVEVSLVDTGVGMTAEEVSRAFDPLYTTKTKGAGLGLAVCQDIVSKHNGSITIESGVGEGTTLLVRIPAYDGRGGALPAPPPPEVEFSDLLD